MSLSSSLDLFDKFRKEIADSTVGEIVSSKLERVAAKNPGLELLFQVKDVLDGRSIHDFECYTAEEVAALKYCPVTSCDVERSFSAFKGILTDKRKSFSMLNLEKYLIVYCNANNKRV